LNGLRQVRAAVDDPDFETLWRENRDSITLCCYRYAPIAAEADEICQRVAIRAWRHFRTLREKRRFLAWVLSIARREVARSARQRHSPLNQTLALPHDDILPASISTSSIDRSPHDGHIQLSNMIDESLETGHLTALEAAVLRERLAEGGRNWAEIGERLGISDNCAAVTHCRAVPKLRMFLFLARRDALGGTAALRAAFDRAQEAASSALTVSEATAFDRIILRDDQGYRPIRWRADLQGACVKVVKFLPIDWP
jgi:RNA polymerase sigma factor (sigma-70 family)